MAQKLINIGSGPNTGTGDPAREAYSKANDNFSELYGHAASTGNPHSVTAAQVGSYTKSQVDSLISTLNATLAAVLDLKAAKDSPAFTGTPMGPTASPGTNTNQLATTAFVMAVRNALLNGAGAAFDTLQELQAALGNDPNFAATVATSLGLRLRIDAAQGLNTTQQGQGRSNLAISAINTPFTAGGGISATNVQTALAELDAEKANLDESRIAWFARSTAPTGWLKCNGAAVSRTTYATLFAIINTTYGAGDGSTTFNVPDARGEFVRSLDDGRGVDSGRVLGSAQAHSFQDHTHKTNIAGGPAGSGIAVFQYVGAGADSANNVSTSGAITGNFGSETRPRNIAFLCCIKY